MTPVRPLSGFAVRAFSPVAPDARHTQYSGTPSGERIEDHQGMSRSIPGASHASYHTVQNLKQKVKRNFNPGLFEYCRKEGRLN
jgi:hypothetical protein